MMANIADGARGLDRVSQWDRRQSSVQACFGQRSVFWTDRQTDEHTNKQANGQIGRQSGRLSGKQILCRYMQTSKDGYIQPDRESGRHTSLQSDWQADGEAERER